MFWQPNDPRVEKVHVLLSMRGHLVNDKTALQSMGHAFNKKVVKNQTAQSIIIQNIKLFKTQIKQIEKEIGQIFKDDPPLYQRVSHLKNISGVGLLFNREPLCLYKKGLPLQTQYSKIAANLGMVPRKYKSGTMVFRKPRSRQQGHRRIRKLLRLAAMSVKTRVPEFEKYYARKQAEGIDNSLILYNISNKLIRIICAVNRDPSGYIKKYQPIHPSLLKNT